MEGSDKARLGRRALLTAGAAGVAAVAAEALAPSAVRAANGDPVRVGQTNTGTAHTVLRTTGAHGLESFSDVGDGLRGVSNHGPSSGVFAYNTHADGYGVYGRNTATNTFGYLAGKENGVYGASPVEGMAAVKGEHSHPYGVAVYGKNTAANAFGGLGAGGNAVYGMAPPDVDHFGLFIIGRAAFATSSGTLTIAKNKSSVSASVPALTAATIVLATLQANRAGVYIQAAVAYVKSGKITIYLNKKVSAATKVAYFILN